MAFWILLFLTTQVVFHSTIPAVRGTPTLEKEVIQWVNALRLEAGRPPLKTAPDLVACARWTSQLLARVQTLTHTLPVDSARTLADRLFRCGVVDQEAGENLYTLWVPRSEYVPSGRGVAEKWRDSPDHRENLLHPSYTHTGVGVVYSGGSWWITQLYVTRDLAPPRIVLDSAAHLLNYRSRALVPHTVMIRVGNTFSDTLRLKKGDSLRLDLPVSGRTCIQVGTPISRERMRVRQAFCVDPSLPRPFLRFH